MEEIKLLTDDERLVLPEVILRRNKFKAILNSFIEKKNQTFSNAMIISGKPGTGKTTLVTEFLDQLQEAGAIKDYKRTAGHMTKVSLFEFLKPYYTDDMYIPTIHVIDDCDCIYDGECLEIMKSAFDTKSSHKTNRMVYYKSGFKKDEYKYLDFCIVITNDDFSYKSDGMKALLDRVHLFNIDLQYDDFKIYSTYIIEKYLNDNPDNLMPTVIESIVDFFNKDIKVWFENNTFNKADINFSIRLIRKFVDLMVLFGDDWKSFSVDYKKLNRYTYKIEEDETK